MKKKVLVNIIDTLPVRGPMGGYVSGVGQATINLINAFNRKEEMPIDLYLYAAGRYASSANFYDWKFPKRIIPIPNRIKYKGNQLDTFIRKKFLHYDLFHITGNYYDVDNNEPFVVTIHDCTDLDENINTDNRLSAAAKSQYFKMANDSKAIITVSEFSKQEVVKYFQVAPEKVNVVYWGIDRNRFRVLQGDEIVSVLNKYAIHKPYFFACSCNRPRKNLVTALRAYKKLLERNPEHIFVVAWSNPFKEIKEEFSKEIESGKIIFLPFLTDEDLVALYNGASMSVYVSRKEGFGLPILESFACGTPVMTCNNSSLYEVGQDAAIYVGEDSIDEMVDVMRMFEVGNCDLVDFKKRSDVIVKSFNWEYTANRYLQIYDNILR